jgi:hypothetical protein
VQLEEVDEPVLAADQVGVGVAVEEPRAVERAPGSARGGIAAGEEESSSPLTSE